MPTFTVPSSYGTLREFNPCHNPRGPGGGQFCSAPDKGGPGGAAVQIETGRKKAKPTQRFGKQVKPSLETLAKLSFIAGLDISDKAKSKRMFDLLKRREPEMVAEVEDMLARGRHGFKEFSDGLTQVADRLGFKTHSNIESREVLRDNTNYVVIGGVKGLERAAVKTAVDYQGDIRQLKDVLRGTIAVRTANEMVTALEELSKVATIEHITDNVTKPMSSGYRDLNVLIRMKGSGMVAEMQLITKPMLRAKMGSGHRLYEAARLLPPDSPKASVLERRMRRLYDRAWLTTAASATALASLAALIQQRGF